MKETIIIPEYITRVQISNARRPTYYKEGVNLPVILKKGIDEGQYTFKEYKGMIGKPKLLYNLDKKEFIVKNKEFVGLPRFASIGGNILYSGLNEHIRIAMITAIKANFTPYMKKIKPITKFPIQITAEIHTIPGLCNWDIDNLWIYIKAFQDLSKELGIIPDDSVRYITKPPSFEFYPVPELKLRKMIFTLETDQRVITNHLMFNRQPGRIVPVKGQFSSIMQVLYVVVGDIPLGEVSITKTGEHIRCEVGLGKTNISYPKLTDSLKTVKYWAIQYNVPIVIDSMFGSEYANYNQDIIHGMFQGLADEGLNIIIHNT
jgi:hypothetical protein